MILFALITSCEAVQARHGNEFSLYSIFGCRERMYWCLVCAIHTAGCKGKYEVEGTYHYFIREPPPCVPTLLPTEESMIDPVPICRRNSFLFRCVAGAWCVSPPGAVCFLSQLLSPLSQVCNVGVVAPFTVKVFKT